MRAIVRAIDRGVRLAMFIVAVLIMSIAVIAFVPVALVFWAGFFLMEASNE